MSKIRIGVVGLEFGAKVLLPAFRKDPRVNVVALAGTSSEKAGRIASEANVAQSYGDWRLMIENEKLDAIAIATPPGSQVEIADAALSKGIHVFAEKPLGINPSQTEQLVRRAQEKGLTTLVDFEFVASPTWEAFKKLLTSTNKPIDLDVQWRVQTYTAKHFIDNWKCRRDDGGGALHVFGSHIFYNLEWCLGPIQNFSAKLFKAPADPRATHTGFELDLNFQEGIRAKVWVDTGFDGEFVHAWRFNAVELVNRGADYLGDFKLSEAGKIISMAEPSGEDGRIAVVAGMARRFLNGIESKSPAEPGFEAGHRVQCLIEKAFQSDEFDLRVDSK